MSCVVRLFACLLTLAVLGCGGGDGRVAVTGTVTLKGQALDQGQIDFEPLESQGTSGSTAIKDGVYTIPRDKGLRPGKYLVRVFSAGYAPGTEPKKVNGILEGPPPKERIPPQYSHKSQLTAVVEASGKNEFPFAIP
ncbi:MAG: carboxypeptidase-like regulatory domain-containing protein [Gemmataceae bacterium]